MTYTAIGMDIGHSAVKLAWNDKQAPRSLIFPSAVVPYFPISEENTRKQAELDLVVIDGKSFYVGETAARQSATSVTGLSMDWINTKEHAALIVAANEKLTRLGVPVLGRIIILGLPVSSFSRQKDALLAESNRLLPNTTIHVYPQPLCAFQTHMLDLQGNPASGRSLANESWATIDVGHYTTDIILMHKGDWIEPASASCSGIYKACQAFQKIMAADKYEVDFLEAEECLKTRRLRDFGKTIDVSAQAEQALEVVISEIREKAVSLLSDRVRKLDGVLITGGGAEAVYNSLIKVWPNTKMTPNPRMAVADGMRRMATLFIRMGRYNNAVA